MAGLDRRGLLAGIGLAAAAASSTRALAAPIDTTGPWTGQGVIKRAGGQIHYVTLGEGEPLVLLHKLGGSSADWRRAAPMLAAKGRKVIAMDLPGHGGSTMLGPPPFIQYVPETAAALKAALDEMGVSRFALGGNSLGGIAGIVMAAFWPESVSKLALVSVSMIPAMNRVQLAKLDADARAAFGPNWEPLPRPPADVAAVGFKDMAVLQEDNESRARTGVWVRPAERGVALVGVTDYMPRVQCPSLVVITDHGRYARYGDVARATMKDVKVVVIPGSGSFIHQERPVETAAAINAFLG